MKQVNIPCVACENENHSACIAIKLGEVLGEPKKHCSCLANKHKKERFPIKPL